MCDHGRCILPVSVCDSQPNCHDHSDEANCSHKHKGKNRVCSTVHTQRQSDLSAYTQQQQAK